jgi:hypothetical protein
MEIEGKQWGMGKERGREGKGGEIGKRREAMRGVTIKEGVEEHALQ